MESHQENNDRHIYVYVAGPYSKGNVNENVRNAIMVGEQVVKIGCTPFVPHLYHLWDVISPHTYEYWMDLDRNWLERCDILLRLPGDSKGADQEMDWAEKNGKTVLFYEQDGLLNLERLVKHTLPTHKK